MSWYGIRINAEDEWLNTFILDPGYAATDMGAYVIGLFGLPMEALTPPDEIADGMFKILRTATKEEHGGKLVLYTGEITAW